MVFFSALRPASIFFQPSYYEKRADVPFSVFPYANKDFVLHPLKTRVSRGFFDNHEKLKQAVHIAQIALIVFSIGFFSSLASVVCVSSCSLIGGYFINRFIDRCTR